MVLDLASKAVKAIATGNTQAEMGAQSPHLASGVTRLARFAYVTSAAGIVVTWYTCYVNTRTEPGSGPTLVLPGVSGEAQYAPSRPDPDVGGLLGKLGGSSSKSPSQFGVSDPSVAGPVRVRVSRVALQMVGQKRIHWAEVRPIPSNILANPDLTDCSGFVTQVYYTAKAPDPNGLGYAMPLQGSSGTMWQHGTQVQSPNIADLAIWSDHVVVIVSLNPTTVVSLGSPSDPGPVKRTLAAQMQIQQQVGQQFLGYRSYI
jgi:hypothetical protein